MVKAFLRKFKDPFSKICNISFTFRHWLKLNIFKSPMDEYLSIRFSLNKLKARFLFFLRNKNNLFENKIAANQFNKLGYAVFTNKEIEVSSRLILKKISMFSNPWVEKDNLDYSNIEELKNEFMQIFNNGVDEFIKSVFKSDYKIFYHILYRSKNTSDQLPQGSSLWHADGGPGICMNLMICHTPVNSFNGAMKIIDWNNSKNLLVRTFYNYRIWYKKQSESSLKSHNRISLRLKKCESLRKLITNKSIRYFQPNTNKSGLVYAFSNNCVHAGGFTKPGFERIVSVMHIYPSSEITTLNEKFKSNHKKIEPYPKSF